MKKKPENTANILLEPFKPYAASMLWTLQRQYFEEMGIDAWRSGEVPHYVTSNPRHARAYAETILGLYRDLRSMAGTAAVIEPIPILELGGGSGRMAFYILRQLEELCADEGIALEQFRYILTDFTQRNLDSWRVHPRFAAYFERGLLDITLLDATAPGPIELQMSGLEIRPAQYAVPLVLVANYLFDSIPQELVYVKDGNCHPVQVALHLPSALAAASPAQVLDNLEMQYALQPVDATLAASEAIQNLLAQYATAVDEAFLLIPALGMDCIAYLRSLSRRGVVLLTADKGSQILENVAYAHPPAFATHGSISHNVNYHALLSYCLQSGGLGYFPSHRTTSVNTGCLLFVENAIHYRETIAAVRKSLLDSSPDTYFAVYKSMRNHLEHMEMEDLMAGLRLGMYDSHQLGVYIARIGELLPTLRSDDAADLVEVMHRCWENYYPLAEDRDLATLIGSVCYTLDAYAEALFYFGHSTGIYGGYTGTYYNMAVCHHMLGDAAKAVALLEMVVLHDPGNAEAQALLAEYVGAESHLRMEDLQLEAI